MDRPVSGAVAAAPTAPWPSLRDELALYPGPAANDGSPTWSLHDPTRNLYFRIDWATYEILCRWPLGNATAIAGALHDETTLRLDDETVDGVRQFLLQRDLVKRDTASETRQFVQRTEQRHIAPLTWLLHHYLFFRLPLWRPDAWLGRTVGLVAWLGSRWFAVLTACVLLFSLFEVSRQWDSFTATLVDLFSPEGILAYLVTLVCVKFLHELGHAYTARRAGCRVPSMGVAFLVMFPMAYTDVNDAWKLPDRRRRLQVGAAGILTELTIAAWAGLAWALLPDGTLRGAMFLLATTTWISTLAINASPFMRFDGYFLLMDWLETPNLHARSFALARWRLRELLFGLGDPVPESLPRHRTRLFILFAWATWSYRAIVFTGIAILVYHVFPKPLGPLLAAVEIGWFLVAPITREIGSWLQLRERIARRATTYRTLLLLGCLIAIMVIPWDSRIRTQAVLLPAIQLPLVAPGSSVISEVLVQDGATVTAGQALVALHSPELAHQRKAAAVRLQGAEWQLNATGLKDELRERQAVIGSERRRAASELQGIELEIDRYRVESPRDGRIQWQHPDLHPGLWLADKEQIGWIVDPDSWQLVTYVPATELARVAVGDTARFSDESGRMPVLHARVTRIDQDATRVMTEGMLASTQGGLIPVREQGQQLIPEQAVYRLTLALQDHTSLPNDLPVLRGRLTIQGQAEAWMRQYWRSAVGLFRREAGF